MKKLLSLFVFFALISCGKKQVEPVSMQEDVRILANDSLEGRGTGTAGEQMAAEYIASRFENLGLQPMGVDGYFQPFTFKPKTDPHSEVEFSEQATDSTVTGTNIIGFIDNQAPYTVVIGAHYDHLGYGGQGSLYRGDTPEIHNGADDNASGVAVMLNLAQRLKEANTGNNYLFMAFSGEEMGLLGSNYFVKNATIDASAINYMFNMDMVGRLKADSTLAVYGIGTSPYFKQVVHATNKNFKIKEHESGVGPSDHTSFYLSDIPVLHFFTGQHEDYHKPSDDSELLNYDGMKMIADYIMDIVTDLDDNGKLSFRATKNESESTPRFKVTLGVVPDYLYSGKGMRIDGVSEDRPAQKAGLMKGDVVIQLGTFEITDMMSYMKALSNFEAGTTTTVKVERDGQVVEAEVTF